MLTYTIADGEVTITDCDTAYAGDLIIPDTIDDLPVTSIGNNAFAFCAALTSITIPDSVSSIGYSAFVKCDILTSVVVDSDNADFGSCVCRKVHPD